MAGNNTTIKGINIAFGADTDDFNKGLKKVNKELKAADKLGKNLQKSLQFDDAEEGIQKLTRYADVLETSLAGNESKAEALRKELKRLDDAGELNTESYFKLNDELTQAETNAQSLRKQIEITNKDINALETGQFDELSNKTKQAFNDLKSYNKLFDELDSQSLDNVTDEVETLTESFDTSGVTDELKNLSSTALDSVGDLGLLGTIFEAGPALLNPYTVAIAAAGVALHEVTKRAKENRDAQFRLELATDSTKLSMDEMTDSSRTLSRSLDIEMSEAAGIASEAIHAYGNQVKSTSDLVKSSLKISALNESGIMDSSDAYSVASANARNFGLDTEENEVLIGKLTNTINSFGRQGEDVLDTYIEWGDTFAATGQDADQMLGILNTGLSLGARSTDEVANAWNELALRIGDGSAEGGVEMLNEALVDTGSSMDQIDAEKLFKQFDKGGRDAQDAVITLVEGLSEVEDATDRTAIAAEIFGTMGEEFVATVAGQKDSIDELRAGFEQQVAIEETLQRARNNDTTWDKIKKDSQLTSGEIENLKDQYDLYGLSAFDASQKSIFLNDALGQMVDQGIITENQMNNVNSVMDTLGGTTSIADTNSKNFTRGLQTLVDTGIITESAMSDLQFAFDLLNGDIKITDEQMQGLNENLQILADRGDLPQEIIEPLSQAIGILGDDTATTDEKLVGLEGAIIAMGAAGLISAGDTAELHRRVKDLADPTTTTTEKLDDLDYIVSIMGESLGISNDKMETFSDKINGAKTAAENGTGSLDNLNGEIADNKSGSEKAADAIDRLTGAYILSQGAMDRNRIKTALGSDEYDRLTGAADESSDAIDDVTDSKNDYNNTDVDETDITVDNSNALTGISEVISNLGNIPTSRNVEITQTTRKVNSGNGTGNGIGPVPENFSTRSGGGLSTYNLSPNIYITNPTNTTSRTDAKVLADQVSREIARRLK